MKSPAATPDELPIEDVLAVEHDVVPLDGAHALQEGEVDAGGLGVGLAEDSRDFPGLPVNDAGEDQRQANRARPRRRPSSPTRGAPSGSASL